MELNSHDTLQHQIEQMAKKGRVSRELVTAYSEVLKARDAKDQAFHIWLNKTRAAIWRVSRSYSADIHIRSSFIKARNRRKNLQKKDH